MADNGGSWPISDTLGDELSSWIDPGTAAEDAFIEKAAEILQYAQDNAPWADRTGAARAGLDVEVDRNGNLVTLQLFHTVEHGLWLEVIQNGEFAIIMPTLERFADEVFRAAGGVVTGETGGEIG